MSHISHAGTPSHFPNTFKTSVGDHGGRLDALETNVADFRQETRGNFRSMDEQLAEIKDLIIAGRDST